MKKMRIAIIGGGPSALFVVKKLLQAQSNQLGLNTFEIDIFERNALLGKGMPYSHEGASLEHVTNISSNELTPLCDTLEDWINKQPQALLSQFDIEKSTFHDKEVIPRLLFGDYLEAQFRGLLSECETAGLTATVHINTQVLDIVPDKGGKTSSVVFNSGKIDGFDKIIICTGHLWPKKQEGRIAGYFESPYPPEKLNQHFNHPVALKGSSLTAIDAIRTLSSANGIYSTDNGQLSFKTADQVPNFKIVMHSLHGLLPNVRFHLEEPLVSSNGMLSEQQIDQHRAQNEGFLSLDFIFENNFKAILKHKDPDFYQKIVDMTLENFVQWMLDSRKAFDPFALFKIEYLQAEQSIETENSIQWKEILALLSFTINHPAKYLSAEDMTRLHKVLLPLIALIIANVPQSSAEQLIALHNSGVLEVIPVDSDSGVQIEDDGEFYYLYKDANQNQLAQKYATFVDCTGQQRLPIKDFPFKSMFSAAPIQPATLRFKDKRNAISELAQGAENIHKGTDKQYYLTLQGLAINDDYQPMQVNGQPSPQYFVMAVPFISGFNPDYSGFDFCDQVSSLVVDKICEELASLTDLENIIVKADKIHC